MRVILDNIIFSLQRSGGGSVYWTELTKRFNDSAEEVLFIDQQINVNNFFRTSVSLKPLKLETRWPLKIRRYLPFTEKIEAKTIFHSSFYRYSTSTNAINVTTVHDFTTELYRKGLAKWVHFYQKKMALKHSHGIICISNNTKKDLLNFHPWINEEKIKVIYNGVSNDFFKINERENDWSKQSEFGHLFGKKLVLFVGHRTAYKNFDKAVEAFSRLQDCEYHFLIIGEKLSNEEERNISKLIDEDQYTVLTGLNNQKLNIIYNFSYVLLYPSSYEGFGIPVIEAMKTGLPVIAAKKSSIPEIAGDAGILLEDVSPQNIYSALMDLENKAYRDHLINKGYLQAEKFNWDKTYSEYLDFYKKLYYGTKD